MRSAIAVTFWSVLFVALLVGAGWFGHQRQCHALTPGTFAYSVNCK